MMIWWCWPKLCSYNIGSSLDAAAQPQTPIPWKLSMPCSWAKLKVTWCLEVFSYWLCRTLVTSAVFWRCPFCYQNTFPTVCNGGLIHWPAELHFDKYFIFFTSIWQNWLTHLCLWLAQRSNLLIFNSLNWNGHSYVLLTWSALVHE